MRDTIHICEKKNRLKTPEKTQMEYITNSYHVDREYTLIKWKMAHMFGAIVNK